MKGIVRVSLAFAVGLVGCAPSSRSGDIAKQATTAPRPRLTRVLPDSVRLINGNVIEIELYGANLDATSNTVIIGAAVLTQVRSSASGTRITIAIPDAVPSGGEAPPTPWMSGRYPLSIRTAAGTSDTLTLVISTAGSMP